jgi:ABC-type ATPase involved in cell division
VNVDRDFVPVIENLITRLGRAGRSVVLTTHDAEQATRLAERRISLGEGRLCDDARHPSSPVPSARAPVGR